MDRSWIHGGGCWLRSCLLSAPLCAPVTVGNLLQRQCSEVTSEALQRRGAALMCTHLCTHTRAHTHLHAHSPLDQEAGGLPELNVAMMTFADVMLIVKHWWLSSCQGTRRVCSVWGWRGKLTLGNSPEAFLQTLNGQWILAPVPGTHGWVSSVQFRRSVMSGSL